MIDNAQRLLQPITASEATALRQAAERYATSAQATAYGESRGLPWWVTKTALLGVVTEPAPGHEAYAGWLAIPYLNMLGEVVDMRFRCLARHDCRDAGHGKYATLPGHPSRLYNLPTLARHDVHVLHVTEGELDCLALQAAGLAAVAAPGAASWKTRHTVLCSGYATVWVWGDGDPAGRRFAQQLAAEIPNARAVPVPAGMDANSILQQQGAEGVTALIQA